MLCLGVFPLFARFSLNRMAFHYALASKCFSGRLKACFRSLKIPILEKGRQGENNKLEYKIENNLSGYRVCLLPLIIKHVI